MKTMKKLLSLPLNLVKYFHQIENKDEESWFCTSDPEGSHVGSGGGTAWLLKEMWKNSNTHFGDWLKKEKRIIMHAGGQSRRLPAYAPSGKILTPIPVFRWERGQKINQNLLDLQIPLYEKILQKSPKHLNTLIASGDVYIQSDEDSKALPDVDIVCYGLWANAELASNHGVFVCNKNASEELLYMLQKPSPQLLKDLSRDQLFLMDIGIWVLSDKAVNVLLKHSGYSLDENGQLSTPENLDFYDLYGDFGLNMGSETTGKNPEINALKIAILPLPKGEFYHFGTSRELISSTLSIQNRIIDQRSILHKDDKPHPSMFVQNADIKIKLRTDQRNLWIENSFIGENWSLQSEHIITGIPKNNWTVNLPNGVCLDIVPIEEDSYCIRPYGFHDAFRGPVNDDTTNWQGDSFNQWLSQRHLSFKDLDFPENTDLQAAPIFPVLTLTDSFEALLSWMIDPTEDKTLSSLWLSSERLSANDISKKASLSRLYDQRELFRSKNIVQLHQNYAKSVFYQSDLNYIAEHVAQHNIDLKPHLSFDNSFLQMQEYMFQAKIKKYLNQDNTLEEQKAFNLLSDIIVDSLGYEQPEPQLNVFQDQIVWGRSPVRIDLAGGWTDTPPYSIAYGGAVVNMAINLNGQPPLQVYIKPSKEYKVILRSIDIGVREDVTTYQEISQFKQVGSAFSIPKAALYISGFNEKSPYKSLEEHLKAFGSGIEITMLAAIPKGSGLGTSSILSATVLGALSNFCGLNWDQNDLNQRTLVLEQLLTTGGGWQDQFGGILPGIKLIETQKGGNQTPNISWAPEFIFSKPENKACMLLYYTGITRTAKNILSEIVTGMFLNESKNTKILKDIKQHAFETFKVLQSGNFNDFSDCVNLTWEQKKKLDQGINPPGVEKIIAMIKDHAAAYKLPGAGGGGYLFIIAKDPQAAGIIRKTLHNNPINNRARFVDIDLSPTGFQVTRS
ncbi:bifunctional fucokinase/fucose-1-phosphate guanylyltransferase [Maribacter polysaccharolyticus]|uniref:bifunctional fucokinase/fucose-1-phosphate guanylyltransferase n=1 Tax=Maribacter polysaccharolyticus TaxID=3020831 RepID=UPI00237F55FA|nr:bifunctional fucokinase/fucose-1-phosphate guanylyltransferase [Maribacter polysaccharolyticus]MDE3743432.1 bifunctional fucokinase/fucose-1-phosphate guanylyltransferase [Maribacter polysaccharolyticus]